MRHDAIRLGMACLVVLLRLLQPPVSRAGLPGTPGEPPDPWTTPLVVIDGAAAHVVALDGWTGTMRLEVDTPPFSLSG